MHIISFKGILINDLIKLVIRNDRANPLNMCPKFHYECKVNIIRIDNA